MSEWVVLDVELEHWADAIRVVTFGWRDDDACTPTPELTRLLDFDITFIWDRIEDPQPDADGIVPKQDDYRLVFFLGFDL